MEAQGKLQVTSETGLASDHAELARSRVQVGTAEIGVVDEIVRFRPELESRAVIEREFFQQADVPILKTGLVDRIANAALTVECAGRGLGHVRSEVTRRR